VNQISFYSVEKRKKNSGKKENGQFPAKNGKNRGSKFCERLMNIFRISEKILTGVLKLMGCFTILGLISGEGFFFTDLPSCFSFVFKSFESRNRDSIFTLYHRIKFRIVSLFVTSIC